MRCLQTVCVGALVLLALTIAAPADADVFGAIELLSASSFEQAEYAHAPDISGDGRYVVFEGSIGGVTGIWRRENRPGGALRQVAGGDAELPSISDSGQYVSFTTNEGARLQAITDGRAATPPEVHEPPNVYVRNMQVEPNTVGPAGELPFTLASAENGSTKELGYEQTAEEREQGQFGSMAAGRSALSADGQKVVFVTTAASNLAGPGTPPLQVAVRDLQSDATQLVSVKDNPATGQPAMNAETGLPEPVPSGAVFTQTGLAPAFAPPPFYGISTGVGASISGDGSTVAWMGENVGQQIRSLPEEQALSREGGAPLWRRIGGGEQEPTREVTGGPDPENSECAAHPEGRLRAGNPLSDPCQGPFRGELVMSTRGPIDTVPQLSADGYTVAFLASEPLVAQGEDFGGSHVASNAYVVDMHPGLSRLQALRPLSEVTSGEESGLATNASILDLAVSPDGEQVAFTTMRTVFPLGSLTYVSAPAAVPGLAELFDVDLADSTLTRVTRGYDGSASSHPYRESGYEDPYFTSFSTDDGALSPSFSDDGALLAFSSTASNLVYGDGNTPHTLGAAETKVESDGSDAFLVNRIQYPQVPTAQVISPAPPGPSFAPQWKLGVTATTLTRGRVRLDLTVPGTGSVHAVASSAVQAPSAAVPHSARRGAHKAAHARRASVQPRSVAAASQAIAAGAAGMASLTLTLAPAFRSLAARLGGLSANVAVTFLSPGHPALRQSIEVSFSYPSVKTVGRSARRTPAARRPPARRTAR